MNPNPAPQDWEIRLAAVVNNDDFSWKDFIKAERSRVLGEVKERIEGISGDAIYPIEVFAEPPEGWQKDVDALAKEKGYRIDNISAHFARWAWKNLKKDFVAEIEKMTNP